MPAKKISTNFARPSSFWWVYTTLKYLEKYDVFFYWLSFQDTTVCFQCNGFYGCNFGQPLCGRCHKFLFGNDSKKRVRQSEREDDAINIAKHFRLSVHERQQAPGLILQPSSRPRQLQFQLRSHSSRLNLQPSSRPLQLQVTKHLSATILQQQLKSVREMLKKIKEDERKQQTSKDVKDAEAADSSSNVVVGSDDSHSFQYKSDTNVSVLPLEILQKIFAHLDDITLLTVSKVSKRWNEILRSDQRPWASFTKKRWPLFRVSYTFMPDGSTKRINWYKVILKVILIDCDPSANLTLSLDLCIDAWVLLLSHLCHWIYEKIRNRRITRSLTNTSW